MIIWIDRRGRGQHNGGTLNQNASVEQSKSNMPGLEKYYQYTRAKPFAVPLTEVSGADVAPRGTNFRDGSWRRRLRVTKSSGDVELFVVWRAQKAAGLIERVRQGL
ncbi:MAG TPA: hypothetical protein VF482_23100 [Trebonia sp.]